MLTIYFFGRVTVRHSDLKDWGCQQAWSFDTHASLICEGMVQTLPNWIQMGKISVVGDINAIHVVLSWITVSLVLITFNHF